MFNFALPFLTPILNIAKKIGWKGWLVIGIAIAAFYLYQKIDRLQERNEELEWLIFAKEAENDTLKAIGQYTVVETLIVSRIRVIHDTTEGQITVDTLIESIPKIYGSIKIDTTKKMGPGSNPISIRVAGEFWYPREYSHRNWMVIHPVAGKTPVMLSKPRSPPKWGLGLSYTRSFGSSSDAHGSDYLGGSVRYQRFTLTSGYDFWQKSLILGISMELLTF